MKTTPLIGSSFRALMPSAKSVVGALVTGGLMEVGASLVKDTDVKEGLGGALGFARDVGLELLGQKPLPGREDSPAEEIAGTPELPPAEDAPPVNVGGEAPVAPANAAPAAPAADGSPKKVPLVPRPASRAVSVGDAQSDYDALEAFENNPELRAELLRGGSVNGTTLRGLMARGELHGERYWTHPFWRHVWARPELYRDVHYEHPFFHYGWRRPEFRERVIERFRGVEGGSVDVSGIPEHAKIPVAGAQASAAPASVAPVASAPVVSVPAASAVPASAVPASAVPASAPAVGAATPAGVIRTMCTCAVYAGTPVLAGPGERIEFKQCDACKRAALETTKYNLGMALGWADAWKNATGVNPMDLGDACGTRPDPTSSSYHGGFGFNDRQYNADLAAWQRCAASAASQQAKGKMGTPVGKASPAAAPAATPAAAPAAPAAPPPVSPTDTAKLAVKQVAARVDKKLDAIKTQMDKAASPAEKTALEREAAIAEEKKLHAEAVANHLEAPVPAATDEHKAAHAKIVAAVHEHAPKGPEVLESMLSSYFAMIPGVAAGLQVFDAPPWGGPSGPAPGIFDLEPGAPMDFPMPDDGSVDLSSLPELSVQGVPAASAAAVRATPAIDGAPPAVEGAPPVGFSMDPSESAAEVEENILEGLGDEERDLVVGYANSGYSAEEVREYAAMYRAAAGNTHEHPGVCDSGCSINRGRATD